MAKRRKKSTHKKSINGTPSISTSKATVVSALKEGGLMLGSALLGGGAGAVIGKHSLLAGIPIVLFGAYKRNKYIASAGLGICISNGFQKPQAQTVSGVEEDMHGFDMDQIKERLGTYFKNFSEKLYLPQDQPTNGIDEMNGADHPTYFINPYNNNNNPSLEGDLDLSQLNKVQSQIAQMNGMDDREF
ncbi:MAG: hypothetical protein JWO58_2833 [Chitinophagaceae bacterium]|nr:hypothetical protein [Chitinophagaceae bacterium]